jgi:hypothetical protein
MRKENKPPNQKKTRKKNAGIKPPLAIPAPSARRIAPKNDVEKTARSF